MNSEQLPGWKLAFIMTCNKEKIENLETNKYYEKKKKPSNPIIISQ